MTLFEWVSPVLSVDLGSISDKKSVLYTITQPLAEQSGVEDAIKANFGTGARSSHLKTASFSEVISNLAAVGFDEVTDEAILED